MTIRKGNVLIELVMVSMLLLLFGATIFTLIIAGSNTQQRILSNKNAEADARVAMSYINVRLRQNDGKNKILVKPNGIDGENAIVIEKATEGGLVYYDWIYFDKNVKQLKEATTDEAQLLTADIGFDIVPIENLTISFSADDNTITTTVVYPYERAQNANDDQSGVKTISSTIALRSDENM